MLYVSWQDQWQRNSYQQNSPDGPNSGEESVTKMVTYHDNSQTDEYPTELLNDFGTTDTVIGDATVETMLTTVGKIPKEMFYVEDSTPHMQSFTHVQSFTPVQPFTQKHSSSTSSTSNPLVTANSDITTKPALGNHSPIFLTLIITLLVLLLLCCITACVISRTKRKTNYFRKCGFQECDLECRGVKQPLLSTDKMTESTSKTDSTKN